MFNIEIYVAGHRPHRAGAGASYGAILKATMPDGREKIYKSSKYLGIYSMNQCNIIAITMALRCILPEFRDHDIILYPTPGYGGQVLERNKNGWMSSSKANIEIVNELRDLFSSFKSITTKKPIVSNQTFLECIELAKKCQKN